MHIDVPSAALRSGALLELGVCARHGRPATRSRVRRFSTSPPGALVVLAFFSFFLVLLLAGLFQKDVRGPVPECDRCARTYGRRITVMWVGLLGGIALVVASLVAQSGLLFAGALALVLAGVGAGAAADLGRVRGDLHSDLVWVELRGVSPAFAEAAAGRVHAAPADPWAVPLG